MHNETGWGSGIERSLRSRGRGYEIEVIVGERRVVLFGTDCLDTGKRIIDTEVERYIATHSTPDATLEARQIIHGYSLMGPRGEVRKIRTDVPTILPTIYAELREEARRLGDEYFVSEI